MNLVLHQTLGGLAVLLAFVSYIPYVSDIFKGKTKPHAISWFIWTILLLIYFAAAVGDNGGPGTWQLGITMVLCASIFLLSLRRGEKQIFRSDWLCLLSAGLAGILWWATNDPAISIVLVTGIDVLAFIPTIRKSYSKPHQETLSTQWIGTVKHGLSVAAMNNRSITTTLYPFALFLMNIVFALLLLTRRRQLGLRPEKTKKAPAEADAFS